MSRISCHNSHNNIRTGFCAKLVRFYNFHADLYIKIRTLK